MRRSEHPSQTLFRSSLMLLFSGLAISFLIAWLIYQNNRDKRLDNILLEQEMRLARAQVLFSRGVGDMKHAIQLLHEVPSLSAALDKNREINRDLADNLFSSFVRGIESLMQVRWVDSQGMEQVRVNVQNGTPSIVSPDHLQNKSSRYYVQQGLKTPEGVVYLSSLDLNIERGQVEIPYRPTARVLLKTGTKKQLHPGLLILNYDIGHLLNSIRSLDSEFVQIQIVDSHGYWILHPEVQLEWGHSLKMPQNNMQTLHPELWQQIQKKEIAKGSEVKFGLVSYKCMDMVNQAVPNTQNAQDTEICFIAMTPTPVVDQQKRLAAWPGLLSGFVIFLFGLWVLNRERLAGMELITLNEELALDKQLLEESAEYTQNLLKQQQLMQNDLVESRKLSALGMMVAGVAHELNTPLGAAIMAASKQRIEHNRLAESFRTGLTKSALERFIEENKQGLDLVEDNQQRAAELVRSFKRLAIDRAKEDIVSFSLSQVINDLIKTLHHRLKVARVTTNLDITDIQMSGTPGIISQVLQNLIMNAIHHAFEPEIGGKLRISAEQHDQTIILKVSDNGRGIDPQILPNLFDPFVTSKRTQGNTGLGMHFVHQWVTASLKGTITVQTTSEKGTTFIIRLPQTLELHLPED
ncbi:hypothetical protein DI392_06365 [Vibrio albus]|uniref:histidine kinase n=1 Tax=Vibrio albus TaxID=2200953 RepID=A0A2U3BAN7_9VIBR|nr:ATP-binding protein [Vibrio albus]PWI33823.1 hypothetical protein DI392_06365 [Vibrio albus]